MADLTSAIIGVAAISVSSAFLGFAVSEWRWASRLKARHELEAVRDRLVRMQATIARRPRP